MDPTFTETDRLPLQDFDLGVDTALELEDQRELQEVDRQMAEVLERQKEQDLRMVEALELQKEEERVRERAAWVSFMSNIELGPSHWQTIGNDVGVQPYMYPRVLVDYQSQVLVDYRSQETSISVSLRCSGLRPRW